MIEQGQTAPEFTLPDQDGNPVSLDDYRGQTVVLYFYPKADTPAYIHSMTTTVPWLGIRDYAGHAR